MLVMLIRPTNVEAKKNAEEHRSHWRAEMELRKNNACEDKTVSDLFKAEPKSQTEAKSLADIFSYLQVLS